MSEQAPPLVRPFRGLRPAPQYAAEVAAPPYDVVSTAEAVELAKTFGSDSSRRFVNGVLGAVSRAGVGVAEGPGAETEDSDGPV